jgi:hypothetical protein
MSPSQLVKTIKKKELPIVSPSLGNCDGSTFEEGGRTRKNSPRKSPNLLLTMYHSYEWENTPRRTNDSGKHHSHIAVYQGSPNLKKDPAKNLDKPLCACYNTKAVKKAIICKCRCSCLEYFGSICATLMWLLRDKHSPRKSKNLSKEFLRTFFWLMSLFIQCPECLWK